MTGQGKIALRFTDRYKIALCRWNFDMSVRNHILLSALTDSV